MFEYVPTAPESLPTAIASRAALQCGRWSRSAWSAHRANLAPKVVGSACMPWVRPVTGTSHELERPCLERVDEGVQVGQEEVGRPGERGAQRGVDHVRGGQPVVDVRTGRALRCAPGRRRRRRPRRGRSPSRARARRRRRRRRPSAPGPGTAAASAAGTTPRAACASVASNSTSSHMREAGGVAEERRHVRRASSAGSSAAPRGISVDPGSGAGRDVAARICMPSQSIGSARRVGAAGAPRRAWAPPRSRRAPAHRPCRTARRARGGRCRRGTPSRLRRRPPTAPTASGPSMVSPVSRLLGIALARPGPRTPRRRR